LRRELPNLHTGDSPRNDESLDLAGALENRVDPVGATISTGHGIFLSELDPQMSGEDLVWTHLGPIAVPVCGSSTSVGVNRDGKHLGRAKQNQ